MSFLRPRTLSIFALYVLVGVLSIKIHASSGYFPMIWFTSRAGLGILAVEGLSAWPILVAASIVMSLLTGYPMVSALEDVLENYIGAYLLLRFSPLIKSKLITVRETSGFIILVIGVSTFIGSALCAFLLYTFHYLPGDNIIQTWKIWWFSAAMGDLVIGAPIICYFNDIRHRLNVYKGRYSEFAGLVILVCIACLFIYTPLAKYNDTLFIRPYFLFAMVIWMAIRFDTMGVLTLNTIVMVTMTAGALTGYVPTGIGTLTDRLFIHQFIAMTLGITGLILAAAIREKEEALDAQNEFISVASHELKTPMTSLKLQYDLYERRLRNQDQKIQSSEAPFFLKTKNQIYRLIKIVEQLLDTTRVENGSLDLNLSKVKLSDLIRNVFERLADDFRIAKSEGKLNVENEVTVQWDAFRMDQVLNNILSNALKYAPGKPVEVNVSADENMAHITVRDYGPGIDQTQRDQIFKRYVRASNPRKIDGLGLGLFIAHQIVAAHGGNIAVTSTPGAGATFQLDIPTCVPGTLSGQI